MTYLLAGQKDTAVFGLIFCTDSYEDPSILGIIIYDYVKSEKIIITVWY